MRISATRWVVGLHLALVCTTTGCAPSISPFSQTAYRFATDLKVETLKLMDRAELPYSDNQKKIDALEIRLEKAFEFSRGRPRNDQSTRQWEILMDPDRNLLGGFLARWDSLGQLGQTFISESKNVVARAFDTIIGLESGKIKGVESRSSR